MKKKSASQSAFFKLRVLLGVLLCFAGTMLVLLALSKASAQPRALPAPASKIAPWVMEHTANGQQAEFFIEFRRLPRPAEHGEILSRHSRNRGNVFCPWAPFVFM